jgi:hypothetical protein
VPPEESSTLFHHHEHDKQLTEAEREKLLSDGASIRGMICHNEPSSADRRIWHVRVEVRFKDEQRVEFSQELDSLYQPAPGSQEAQRIVEARSAEQLRHPDRVPKIQLPLSDGCTVPVRYDEANRSRLVIDVPALQKRALHDYIEHEKKQAPVSKVARTGPPWVVPAHCPNCGAPVDQAKAARDADPHCQFCSQPIPVSPVL